METLLRQGAVAHGWKTALWTATRVTTVIERPFGVHFHPEHVRKILRWKLGWTSQKPEKRARERDEQAIQRWAEERFPQVKKAERPGAYLLFLDEAGFLLTPTVRRSLAPRGQTPILDCWDRRDRLSAISGITVSPVRKRLNLYFHLLPDHRNAHAEDTVAFLEQLRRHLRRPLVVGGTAATSMINPRW